MKDPKILASGEFFEKDMSVDLIKSKLKIQPENAIKIEKIWDEKMEEAKKNNLNLYNGLGYRLENISLLNNKLNIDFSLIEFKQRYGIKKIGGYIELSEDYHPKGCYSLATVKTSDGKYIMVELSGKSTNINKVDLLGGVIEPEETQKSNNFIFNSLLLELNEESGLTKLDIRQLYLKTIYLSKSGNVGFYFEIQLNIDSNEVKERFKTVDDVDIKDIMILDRNEYVEILKNHNLNKQLILKELSV